MIRRLLTVLLIGLAALLAGCAGVPDASAPQAIGTVERPAPDIPVTTSSSCFLSANWHP